MVAIKYDNKEIQVPDSWNDINLGLYEEINVQKPQTRREHIEFAARLCNVDSQLLLSWPVEVFNTIVEKLNFILEGKLSDPCPEVEIDNIKYIVPIEDDLKLGQWVDVETVQKDGEKVLSNILAIVCLPPGEEYDCKRNDARAAMFAAQPMSKLTGVLAFFLHCKTAYEQRTQAYTNLIRITDRLPKSIKPLLKSGTGIRLSTIWLAVKYYSTIMYLTYQLRKFSRICSTKKIKVTQKKSKAN